MLRYNLLLILAMAVWISAPKAQANEPTPPLPPKVHKYWTGSFISWLELVDIDSGTLSDRAHANFYGLGIGRVTERYSKGSTGTIREFAVVTGQANAGGSQTVLTTYKTSQQKWFGAQASLRFAYRPTSLVALSVGPTVLFRSVKFPDEGTGYTIKSGSDLNLGAIGEVRLRLTDKLSMHQTFGTLAFKAATIWSFGVGYTF